MKRIKCTLPLPVSKNNKHVRKGFRNPRNGKWQNAPLLSDECRILRTRIALAVGEVLKAAKMAFDPKAKTIIECVWHMANKRRDIVNFHDELADALKGPLGVDDRYYLVRDMDVIYDKGAPERVEVLIYQPEEG